MKPEISRKAAIAIQSVSIKDKLAFIKAIEKAETMSDIPQPYRSWVEGKTPSYKTD
jgi:hypothetical protein